MDTTACRFKPNSNQKIGRIISVDGFQSDSGILIFEQPDSVSIRHDIAVNQPENLLEQPIQPLRRERLAASPSRLRDKARQQSAIWRLIDVLLPVWIADRVFSET